MPGDVKDLFSAVDENNISKVKTLLDNGTNTVNQRDMEQDGQTPLHIAATKGNFDMVKVLVEKYFANFDLEDMFGEVAVHKAADCGHLAIVSYLLSKKCQYSQDVQHLVATTGDALTLKQGDAASDLNNAYKSESDEKLEIKSKIGEGE